MAEIYGGLADEYVKLPLAKDGKPIHIGDRVFLDTGKKTDVAYLKFTYVDGEADWDVILKDGDWSVPSRVTHYQPTFEDLLYDLVNDVYLSSRDDNLSVDDVVKRYEGGIRKAIEDESEQSPETERTCTLKWGERISDTNRWCSVCKKDLSNVPIEITNYCPNCGRRVVEF